MASVTVRPQELIALQGNQSHIRNLCVLAHVDHGKTTLTDNLIVSNGIISQRLAGKVRYMDSRPDEAQRGITMKSSSISLLYNHSDRATGTAAAAPFLINLIDSPGHVDFSSEVSTAVRVTDGALVVVDVVEGVCIQTESVLRQARLEGVKPVLVLNKMDRLMLELNYTPVEAYNHLRGVLTAVNAVCALLWRDEHEAEPAVAAPEAAAAGPAAVAEEFFSPLKGNVVFASAVHGWGFSLYDFARLFAVKLGMKHDVLLKTLWGDYFLSGKSVTTKNPEGTLVPMFAQLCVKQLWDVYAACLAKDMGKLEKIFQVLNINVPARDLRTQDRDVFMGAILSRWLPLSTAVLALAVEQLPDPVESQKSRVRILCTPLAPNAPPALAAEHAQLLDAVARCDAKGPVIAFISKVFPADDPGALVQAQRRVRQAQDREHAPLVPEAAEQPLIGEAAPSHNAAAQPFVAFCRIFSGTLSAGARVWLLGARYDPLQPTRYAQQVSVEQLFLLMGRALEPMDSVSAGNVFGIGGISHLVLKTATLCSSLACTPFSVMPSASHPIVQVAVEPKHSYELPQLAAGLELLNQADPCVRVSITEAGEHLLTAAGEMHLELCLRDLRERYARVDIEASTPIVPFRESISNEPGRNEELKVGVQSTADRTVTLTVQARPLPANVVEFLDRHADRVDVLLDAKEFSHDDAFRNGLEREMAAAGTKWLNMLPYLWAIGPRGVGCNMIFNRIADYSDTQTWQSRKTLRFQWNRAVTPDAAQLGRTLEPDLVARNAVLVDLDGTIESGFSLASSRGPLCEEPMMGVCFVVVNAEVDVNAINDTSRQSPYGPLSGQMIVTVRDALRSAFLSKAARLYEATYVCDVRTTEKFQGKVSTVLGRRRADIFQQDYDVDHSIITLRALLPVRESFGLYQEMIAETSGGASIYLMLHGWKLLDMDPFLAAKTVDDFEDFGDNVGCMGTNVARQLLDEARRRKGLPVEEKLVEGADKQRTLSKKK